ncbi:MAG: SEC-C metal-binding domain-containing protein [bacterium]|nr:SEC-C metal-binding domain-containing protein [bacterium]
MSMVNMEDTEGDLLLGHNALRRLVRKDGKFRRKLMEDTARFAVEAPLCMAYEEVLQLRTIEQLRVLAKSARIRPFRKLSKEELIKAASERMLSAKRLLAFILDLSDEEWRIFKGAASREKLDGKRRLVIDYEALYIFGFIQPISLDGGIWLVMPGEIKALFKKLKNELDLVSVKDMADSLRLYANAAASLYGVVTVEEFMDIYESYNGGEDVHGFPRDLMVMMLRKISAPHLWSCWALHDGCIVNLSMQDNFEIMDDIMHTRHGKVRYAPPQEVFEAYADEGYVEPTPAAEALESYLAKSLKNGVKGAMLLSELRLEVVNGADISDLMELLAEEGAVPEKDKSVPELVGLAVNFMNDTRLWDNYGWTPKELADSAGAADIPARSEKIERNAPCPCGSGKKYKNCCGK